MANNIVLQPAAGDTFALSQVAASVTWGATAGSLRGSAVYTLTTPISASAAAALVQQAFLVAGFTNANNNGSFLCLSATTTTITLNNVFAATEVHAATATYSLQGFPVQYTRKIENLIANQQGDSVYVNANSGDTLVAVAIGLKSLWPFDQLHGESPAFGYLQGLNDFNANPSIEDTTGTAAPVTSAQVGKNVYSLSKANLVATITATAVAAQADAITNIAITTNVLTVTSANTFKVGEQVTLIGLTTATFLNGQVVTVLTSPGATFTAAFTHADYVSAADTGTATGTLLTVTATNTFSVGQTVLIAGTQEAALNGQSVVILSATGAVFTANSTLVPYTNAADTGTATQVSTSGSTVYTGTGLASLAGYYFTVAGFSNSQNNGTFLCTASSATTLTLSNADGVGELNSSTTATDYVVTLAGTFAFSVGQSLQLGGFQAATFLNGQIIKVVTQTGIQVTANYPQYTEEYVRLAGGVPVPYPQGTLSAVAEPQTVPSPALPVSGVTIAGATPLSGNTWTLVENINLVDADYTPTATPPVAPNPWPACTWSLDGYYPSLYAWVATGVSAGPYNVRLLSCYQNGIDAPADLAAGKPIFDGGVNFQVFRISGSTGLDGGSVPTSVGTSASASATAPASLVLTAANGDMVLSIGLMKSGNAVQPGSVGGTATSLVLSKVTPLNYGPAQFAQQNFGGAVYTGTITGGANNAFAGYTFTVTGFGLAVNNGTFTCTASSATTLTLSNGNAVAETHAGTAAYTALMSRISNGKLVGSEAHYIVEYAFTAAPGTFNPSFQNPLGYEMVIASLGLASS